MESNDSNSEGEAGKKKTSRRGPLLHQWFQYDESHTLCSEAVGKNFKSKKDRGVIVKVISVFPLINNWKENRQEDVAGGDIPAGMSIPTFVITAVTGIYTGKTFVRGVENFFDRFEIHTVEMK